MRPTVPERRDGTRHDLTFFCRGSRNVPRFLDAFDEVFVLTVDRATLADRLALRPADEFGGDPGQRDFILRLHADGADVPAEATAIRSDEALDRGRR